MGGRSFDIPCGALGDTLRDRDRVVATWSTVQPALARAALTAGMGPVPMSAGSTPALALATILNMVATASVVWWWSIGHLLAVYSDGIVIGKRHTGRVSNSQKQYRVQTA